MQWLAPGQMSQVQCTPPLCSARCKPQHRASPDFARQCGLSERAFTAASTLLPREWVFELYLGKLCASSTQLIVFRL
jgi:hypothetical protein